VASGSAAPRSSRARLVVLVLAAIATVGLCALGVWQVERRAWKLDLIERVDARVHATPTAAPGPDAWPTISAAQDEYRRVTASGHFLNESETLVQAVTDLGGGFWVLTPFQTTAGFTVLVNRGFVPPDKRSPSSRTEGQTSDETTITGLLRLAEPGGGFLRSNDPAGDRWFSRDVAAIAIARGLTGVAPYFIDADATANPGGSPVGGLTVVRFNNNHLVYALTWFALAGMAAFGGYIVWRRRP